MDRHTQKINLKNLIFAYLSRKKWILAGFLITAVIWSVDMSMNPYLLKRIIDKVGDIHNASSSYYWMHSLILPGTLYISLSIITNLSFRLYDYVNLRLYPEIKSFFDTELLAYVLNHSYSFFQNTYTGALTQRIADFVIHIEPLISIPNEWFYPRILAALIASTTLFYVVHPIFGVSLLLWAIGFVSISYWLSKKSEPYASAFAKSVAELNGSMSDALSNAITTKLFNNIDSELQYIQKDVKRTMRDDMQWRWYDLKVSFMKGIGVTILIAWMLFLLVQGIYQGYVHAGDVVLVMTLSIYFGNSVHDIGRQLQQFFKTIATCRTALNAIRVPYDIQEKKDAYPLVVNKGNIDFREVGFHYDTQPPIFQDLTLSIPHGQKVGLVGASGAGKSTFIKLLLRFFDIHRGSISIDEQNIKEVTQHSLRHNIGVIPQETELFHRSIMENIRLAKTHATDEEVIAAAQKARCHEFIMHLPEQYASCVGERGVKLSGGQRQRIAIARAFLKNAPILILDEATAALDSETEQDIHAALHDIVQGKTTLVIAHRLSTLKDMDRILVFEHGKIIEDGNTQALLTNRDSYFYGVWHRQVQGFMP